MIVLGDFNIHLGDDYAGHSSLGGCLPPGASSKHSHRCLEFCECEGLSVSQTFQDKSKLKQGNGWSTWRHPRTGNPSLKDFILVPKEEVGKVQCWLVQKIDVGSDHSMVVC